MESSPIHHKQSSHLRLESKLSEGSSISSEFEPPTMKKRPQQLGGRRPSTRSQSILIQRVPPTTMSEEELFVKSEYDWMTWRMYHRIMDYRQKHPINYIVLEESLARNVTHDQEHDDAHSHSFDCSHRDTSDQVSSYDDVEIFELDM